MCAAGALRGEPASITATRRRALPSTSAALSPAAPPPTTTSEIEGRSWPSTAWELLQSVSGVLRSKLVLDVDWHVDEADA